MSGPQGPWPSSSWDPAYAPRTEGTWRSPGYRPSRGRAQVAMVAIAIATIADFAVMGIDLRGIGILQAARTGALTAEQATSFNDAMATAGLVQVLLLCISGICFLAWLSRVVEDIPPLTGGTPRWGPRHAIGWWFVPIASWVIPYAIVGDAARRLRPAGAGDLRGLRRAWWIAWLVGYYVGGALTTITETSVGGVRVLLLRSAIFDASLVVSGVLLVLLVHRMQTWVEERAEALGSRLAVAPDRSAAARTAGGRTASGDRRDLPDPSLPGPADVDRAPDGPARPEDTPS